MGIEKHQYNESAAETPDANEQTPSKSLRELNSEASKRHEQQSRRDQEEHVDRTQEQQESENTLNEQIYLLSLEEAVDQLPGVEGDLLRRVDTLLTPEQRLALAKNTGIYVDAWQDMDAASGFDPAPLAAEWQRSLRNIAGGAIEHVQDWDMLEWFNNGGEDIKEINESANRKANAATKTQSPALLEVYKLFLQEARAVVEAKPDIKTYRMQFFETMDQDSKAKDIMLRSVTPDPVLQQEHANEATNPFLHFSEGAFEGKTPEWLAREHAGADWLRDVRAENFHADLSSLEERGLGITLRGTHEQELVSAIEIAQTTGSLELTISSSGQLEEEELNHAFGGGSLLENDSQMYQVTGSMTQLKKGVGRLEKVLRGRQEAA